MCKRGFSRRNQCARASLRCPGPVMRPLVHHVWSRRSPKLRPCAIVCRVCAAAARCSEGFLTSHVWVLSWSSNTSHSSIEFFTDVTHGVAKVVLIDGPGVQTSVVPYLGVTASLQVRATDAPAQPLPIPEMLHPASQSLRFVNTAPFLRTHIAFSPLPSYPLDPLSKSVPPMVVVVVVVVVVLAPVAARLNRRRLPRDPPNGTAPAAVGPTSFRCGRSTWAAPPRCACCWAGAL
jgi:hypothetical protein